MDLDQGLFIVFFVYGLAFFGMGLAMAMESGRGSALMEARVLRPLAGFGLIHGAHEWLESYLLQAASPGLPPHPWLPWLRLGLLIGSFSSLSIFAFQSLRMTGRPLRRNHKIMLFLLAGYFIFIAASAIAAYHRSGAPWVDALDGLARYLLAVPASALAAMGLRARSLQARGEGPLLSLNLGLAAPAFAFYALTQLFVRRMEMFPANFINEESFLASVGFPIQLARTVAAVVVTVGLLRAAQAADEIRQRELFAAQRARLQALEEQESLRRELLRHTVRAQEDERARIARELHDETAQALSAFTLELAALRNDRLNKSGRRQVVGRLQELSGDMSRGLFRLVHDLRPSQLDDLGLVSALRFLCEQETRKFNLNLEFEVVGAARRLDSLVETALYRVGQEALKNLALHSQVREGRVEIVFLEGEVVLRVADRGRGFDPAQNFRPPHGWGLAGMKERVEAIGGALRIVSAPGAGTVIEAHVPVKDKELR